MANDLINLKALNRTMTDSQGNKILLEKVRDADDNGSSTAVFSSAEKANGQANKSWKSDEKTKNNFNTLFKGFNIFKMNPYDSLEDKGGVNQYLFESPEYDDDLEDFYADASAAVNVPKNLDYSDKRSAKSKFSQTIANSSKDEAEGYERKLGIKVSAKAKVVSGSFAGNATWKSRTESKASNKQLTLRRDIEALK